MRNETRHLPARLLTPDERALVAEWFETTGDVASAHVSSRRSDDPDFLHRVLVATGPDEKPSHIVYAPAGRDIWIVVSSGIRTKVKRFSTLRDALNCIRPVLRGALKQLLKSSDEGIL